MYNYFEEVKNDVKEYIKDDAALDIIELEHNRDEIEERLYDEMFVSDCVTGNASGSYFFNTYKSEEAICHNLDLLGEALEAFGSDYDVLKNGAEACDVTIRCYVLGQVLSEAIDELLEEAKEE